VFMKLFESLDSVTTFGLLASVATPPPSPPLGPALQTLRTAV